MSEFDVLTHELKPLQAWLEDPEVTEVQVYGTKVYVQRQGRYDLEEAGRLDSDFQARQMAQQLAAATNKRVAEDKPSASSKLPGGARVQVVVPTRDGALGAQETCFAIRLHRHVDTTFADYVRQGAFQRLPDKQIGHKHDSVLLPGEVWGPERLKDAVKNNRSILISGATRSGKTHLMRALVKLIPEERNHVILQDEDEMPDMGHRSVRKLMVAREGEITGDPYTFQQAFLDAMRLRPDWLLVQEIRGAEAFTYLRGLASGHPGITTVHSSSAKFALENALPMAVVQDPRAQNMPPDWIIGLVKSVIDVVVQIKLVPDEAGNEQRYITEIHEPWRDRE